MFFRDRKQAGKLLAERLSCFKKQPIIVYAIPRGGVVIAAEIATSLAAPLDLIIAHKIGHPFEKEYAIAAISENGNILGDQNSLAELENNWLQNAILTQREEIKRRRETYLSGRQQPSVEGKIAILVDDGIATGYTFRAAIQELKTKRPAQIVTAVPVIPKEIADVVESEVDELVALTIPAENEFLGAIGSYYEIFPQVEDEEVISILANYHKLES